jgi:hypothetical protein
MFSMCLSNDQLDPLNDIVFLEAGEIQTVEKQFHIDDNITVRRFFNGRII